MMIRCSKNIKELKFLGLRINWKGDHAYRICSAEWSEFLSSWSIYFSCSICGIRDHRSFVSDSELIQAGIEIPRDRRRLVEEINEKRKMIEGLGDD